MPFPLAHPSVALLLRRWCPRFLDFSSLVVGSITPDLATSIDDWEYFSHTILGSFVFCLPAGILTLWIFYRVRVALVLILPNPHREVLLPLCFGIPNSRLISIVSLLLGSWIHISWDFFTHDHSWVVQHVDLFSASFASLRINNLLWLISSLGGMLALMKTYISLLKGGRTPVRISSPSEYRAYILWCSIFVLPFVGAIPRTLHDLSLGDSAVTFLRILSMYYLGCSYLTLALVGFLLEFLKARGTIREIE